MDKHLSYVPELELGLHVDYYYDNQWFINSSVRYIGDREALTYSEGIYCYKEVATQLSSVLDLNVKVNFAFSKQLGFYLEAVNLLNQDFLKAFQQRFAVCWYRPPFRIPAAEVDLKFPVHLGKFD